MTRKMQGRIGKNGAELRATFESLRVDGVCKDKYWPFRIPNVNKEPSLYAYSEPLLKIKAFQTIQPAEFNTSIDARNPVAIGLRTGRQFWSLKGQFDQQFYEPINTINNRESKGHAVTIIGYDNSINGGSWIIANSLGPKWGDHGIGLLPYRCAQDIGEAYSITEL